MAQEDLITARAASQPWCDPHDAGFTGMQNAGVVGSWSLPFRFQRKSWEAQKWPMRDRCGNEDQSTVQVSGSKRWQEYGNSAVESCRRWVEPAPGRGYVGCKRQSHGMGLPEPFGSHMSPPVSWMLDYFLWDGESLFCTLGLYNWLLKFSDVFC